MSTQPYRSVLYLCNERFKFNMSQFEKTHPLEKMTPVLKANAYGHGIENLLNLMKNYRFKSYAVTTIDECLAFLNHSEIKPQILHGPTCANSLDYDKKVEFVISLPEHLKWLSMHHHAQRHSYWLKVDLGLNRLGFSLSQARILLRTYRHLWKGLFGHLGAIEQYPEISRHKALSLRALADEFDLALSLENSEGLGHWHKHLVGTHVRVGLSFYGYAKGSFGPLLPLARLYSPLIKKFSDQARLVGYDWKSRSTQCVYLTPLGYGDGINPHIQGACINNQTLKVLGPVMMDLCYLEQTSQPLPLFKSGCDLDYACWFGHKADDLYKLAQHLQLKPYVLLAQLAHRLQRTTDTNIFSTENVQGTHESLSRNILL